MKYEAAVVVLTFLLSACGTACQSRSTGEPTPAHTSDRSKGVPVVTKTTICAIAADPRQFYDKRIAVAACVMTDGIERTVLRDQTCPYTGINVTEGGELRPEQRFFPERDKEICGMFTGTFRASVQFEKMVLNTNVLEVDQTAELTTKSVAH